MAQAARSAVGVILVTEDGPRSEIPFVLVQSPTWSLGMTVHDDMFDRALRLFQKRDFTAAEALCRSLLDALPDHPGALGLSGAIALMSNQPEVAEEFLKRAVTLQPRSHENVSNLGAAYIQLRRFEDALRVYKAAAVLRPKQVSTRINLATAHKALQQYEMALTQLRPFLGGRDPAVHLEFAELSMLAGDIPAAIKSLRKVVAAFPNDSSVRRKLAEALQKGGNLKEAVREFARIAERNPSEPAAQAEYGAALAKAGDYDQAITIYRQSVEKGGADAVTLAELGQIFRDRVPAWHFTMLADPTRNVLYDEAIRAAVRPGAVVLDIGTGSGLLAMIAARAGASHVYACEAEPLIAEKARDIVARNGLSERITVIGKASSALRVGEDIPARADVLISEIVDVELLGENIVGTLDHALAELVADGAAIIPCAGSVHAMMVESEPLYRQDRVGAVAGFDLSAFNEFSRFARFTADIAAFPYTSLSAPMELFRFDFTRRGIRSESRLVKFLALRPGVHHGLVLWFELALDKARNVSAAPRSPSHWKQSVYLFDNPRPIKAGDSVSVTASHDRRHVYLTAA